MGGFPYEWVSVWVGFSMSGFYKRADWMDMFLYQKMNRILAALALMVGLLVVSPVYAGVGMLQEGENLYISDLGFAGGNSRWDVQRNKIPSICNRRNLSLIQGYEYGYSYFHTIFATATFAYRHCGQINRAARVRAGGGVVPGTTLLSGQSSGLGDVEVGVRTRFNHHNTAAWEALLIIPTGYDNNSPSRLGRGALGLGLGVLFASRKRNIAESPWGWKLGTRFTYFFSGKGNTLRSFATVNYAFSDSNFEQSGDFLSLSLIHNVSFSRNGLQRNLFFNQVPVSITNSDQTKVELSYSHSFGNGWSTSIRGGKAFFGRNSPSDYIAGWSLNYRWRD